MGLRKLDIVFRRLNIPNHLFCLNGSLKEDSDVIRKTKSGWEVYYVERGIKVSTLSFNYEYQACDYLLGKVLRRFFDNKKNIEDNLFCKYFLSNALKASVFSRNMIVPFDPSKPDNKIIGLLCPLMFLEKGMNDNYFVEVDSIKKWNKGKVVNIGVEISEYDLLNRIIQSERKIESLLELTENLSKYLIQIKSFRLGDIIEIKSWDEKIELIKSQNEE